MGRQLDIVVQANNEEWTPGPTLSRGEMAVLSVPRNKDGSVQQWGVIDPNKYGLNGVTGAGGLTGEGSLAPGYWGGAMIVQDGSGALHVFPADDGSLTIAAEGRIQFKANDYGDPHHPIEVGFHGERYKDNVGAITVHCDVSVSALVEYIDNAALLRAARGEVPPGASDIFEEKP